MEWFLLAVRFYFFKLFLAAMLCITSNPYLEISIDEGQNNLTKQKFLDTMGNKHI
jgi:hypothetical protein